MCSPANETPPSLKPLLLESPEPDGAFLLPVRAPGLEAEHATHFIAPCLLGTRHVSHAQSIDEETRAENCSALLFDDLLLLPTIGLAVPHAAHLLSDNLLLIKQTLHSQEPVVGNNLGNGALAAVDPN